jgi:F-type H+-transporting ATPase subunit delta
MAQLSSIARPYALAAFEYARNKQALPEWKAFLENAAFLARQSAMIQLLANPELTFNQLFDLFHEILANTVSSVEQKNFLLLLAQYKRFNLLPDIASLFNMHYEALEKVSKVRVITAIPIQADFNKKLSQALSKRIQQDVKLECDVDPSIIGGAIIHIDDNVIDGSIRGKLTRLLESLTD